MPKQIAKPKIDGVDILTFLPGHKIEDIQDIIVNQDKYVNHIRLRKKSGKFRKIVAPNDAYKNVLRTLLLNFFIAFTT